MNIDTSLAPRFAVFHYSIKWFIEHFGSIPYFAFIVGGVGTLCMQAIRKSIKAEEWDRAFMIVVFALILIGGLIGLGVDIINGYAYDPLAD